MKRLAVVGTGYVGLVSGAMFASVGNHVTCVDKDPSIVEALQAGKCTIHEPGLDDILRSAILEGTLNFATNLAEAVEAADAVFIAVGTPSLESGAYDFQYVEAAAREIGRAMSPRRQYLIVLKSTVTPEIYERVQTLLLEETLGSAGKFELISNPEFLAEGTAVRDFGQPHRIIVGALSNQAKGFMEALYAPFTKRKPGLLHFTDPKSAIVTKLAANSFLACRVALINEVARYCEAVGADIERVRTGLASDPRIGDLFLYAGPGYGGSCFGKDIRALRESARQHGTGWSLIPAIEESNNRHKLHGPQQLERYFGSVAGKTIAIWGLAFKARTDDIRESPAVNAIENLLRSGAEIQAHDPEALQRSQEHFGNRIKHFENKYEAVRGAHALVIMTEWDAYKSPDYRNQSSDSGQSYIRQSQYPGRRKAREAGLVYVGMGRCVSLQDRIDLNS
ncbi:MAG: UDP-glucose/GDP-mannose dehydrogenase family protein [Bryobacteraceae bacterium]